jgi:hypothetical protein
LTHRGFVLTRPFAAGSGIISRVKWRQDKRSETATRVAADVEQRCVAAFGRALVKSLDVGTATTIRALGSGAEPLLLVVVNGRGDVSVSLDSYEYDGDWRAAVDTLGSPRLADVHRSEAGVHCFVLDGPGGSALFTEMDERAISDADTDRWLRSLPGWSPGT